MPDYGTGIALSLGLIIYSHAACAKRCGRHVGTCIHVTFSPIHVHDCTMLRLGISGD